MANSANGDTSDASPLVQLLHALRQPLEHSLAPAHSGAGHDPAVMHLPPAMLERQRGLLLAEAVVRRAATDQPCTVRHVAVIGPTQTGKSSAVNALIDTPAPFGEVSPLAGFTVHPHGFWIRSLKESSSPVATIDWLPALRRVARHDLNREELDTYCVEAVETGSRMLPECVIWDTPDFDSISAVSYQRGLLEVLALADAYVLVLSKEKYADLSAWKLLRLLAPLERPLFICLNKMTSDAAQVVPAAMRSKLAELTPQLADAAIEVLPYLDLPESERAEQMRVGLAELRTQVAQELEHIALHPRSGRAAASQLLRANWDAWTAPLQAEHAAHHTWRVQVRAAGEEFLRSYRRDFLDDPKRYDSFRRATAELLQLLEIPGFSQAVGTVRQVVSWPIRKLVGLGRDWVTSRRPHSNRGGEESLLLLAAEDMLLHLRRFAAQREHGPTLEAPLWRAIHRRIDQDKVALQLEFASAIEQHVAASAEEIHRTADELYRTLQKQPAALNTLRAARATADLGGILFAIKTGGAHLHDLVLAPAMLALTTLMTEGALGSYMGHIAAGLKERLYTRVRQDLVERVFTQRLERLATDLPAGEIIGLSPENLAEARRVVQAWEQAA